MGDLAVLLLYEGVGYGLHAVLRTDQDDGGSSADHQPQLPGVFCQLQLVVWICTQTHKGIGNARGCSSLCCSFCTFKEIFIAVSKCDKCLTEQESTVDPILEENNITMQRVISSNTKTFFSS